MIGQHLYEHEKKLSFSVISFSVTMHGTIDLVKENSLSSRIRRVSETSTYFSLMIIVIGSGKNILFQFEPESSASAKHINHKLVTMINCGLARTYSIAQVLITGHLHMVSFKMAVMMAGPGIQVSNPSYNYYCLNSLICRFTYIIP